MTRKFLDSNVLLYSVKAGDPRRSCAAGLLDNGGIISVQCLNEFASVARRKLAMDWDRVTKAIEAITDLCDAVVPLTIDLHRLGLEIARRYRLSVYDGMIAAAALTGDCDTLYSEDMHDGLLINGRLRIINPFA